MSIEFMDNFDCRVCSVVHVLLVAAAEDLTCFLCQRVHRRPFIQSEEMFIQNEKVNPNHKLVQIQTVSKSTQANIKKEKKSKSAKTQTSPKFKKLSKENELTIKRSDKPKVQKPKKNEVLPRVLSRRTGDGGPGSPGKKPSKGEKLKVAKRRTFPFEKARSKLRRSKQLESKEEVKKKVIRRALTPKDQNSSTNSSGSEDTAGETEDCHTCSEAFSNMPPRLTHVQCEKCLNWICGNCAPEAAKMNKTDIYYCKKCKSIKERQIKRKVTETPSDVIMFCKNQWCAYEQSLVEKYGTNSQQFKDKSKSAQLDQLATLVKKHEVTCSKNYKLNKRMKRNENGRVTYVAIDKEGLDPKVLPSKTPDDGILDIKMERPGSDKESNLSSSADEDDV